jgi:Ca-activated chloride channel family protein
LLLIPLTLAAYIWMRRRRRKFAVRYSSLSLIREALPLLQIIEMIRKTL